MGENYLCGLSKVTLEGIHSFLIDTLKFFWIACLESGMQHLNSILLELGLSFSPPHPLTECLNLPTVCFSQSVFQATFHQGRLADIES